jgi:hypothetical protein
VGAAATGERQQAAPGSVGVVLVERVVHVVSRICHRSRDGLRR